MFLKGFKAYAAILLCLTVFNGYGKDLSKNYEIGINKQAYSSQDDLSYKITSTFVCSKSGEGVMCKNGQISSKELSSKDVSVYTNIFYENESKDRVSLAEVLKNIKLEKLFYNIDIKNTSLDLHDLVSNDLNNISIKNTFSIKEKELKVIIEIDNKNINMQIALEGSFNADYFTYILSNMDAYYDLKQQAVLYKDGLNLSKIVSDYFSLYQPKQITLNVKSKNQNATNQIQEFIYSMFEEEASFDIPLIQLKTYQPFVKAIKQEISDKNALKISLVYNKPLERFWGMMYNAMIIKSKEIYINDKPYKNGTLKDIAEKECENDDKDFCIYLAKFYANKQDYKKSNVGFNEVQEKKIVLSNYDKKDYFSISKACDNGHLNACADKYEVDENKNAYKELCKKHGAVGACKRYFSMVGKYGKACEAGDIHSCSLGNKNSYFDYEDKLKMYKAIKTVSDNSKSTYEKNLKYVAYLFLEDTDKKIAADYIYKFCRAGLVDWCFEVQNKTSTKDYDLLQTSYDVAKKECKKDYEFCRISLRYAETINDIATQEQTLLTLARKGVFLEPELIMSIKIIDLQNTNEYKNKLLKSLKAGCDLGSKTTCKMIGFLDESKVTPATKHDLMIYIRAGKPLDKIDTSKITDMSNLFANSKREDFSGIETWDTSNVTSMNYMFYEAIYFNHDISKWNTKNVVGMNEMFYNCSDFNQPIGSWDVSNLVYAKSMFYGAKSFNQPLDSWDVSSLRHADSMFFYASSFNQDLSNWSIKARSDDFRDMLRGTPIQDDKSKYPKILE